MNEPVSISNVIANKTFNSNAHAPIYDFQSNVNFTDLDVFTQGQPFDHFKKNARRSTRFFTSSIFK